MLIQKLHNTKPLNISILLPPDMYVLNEPLYLTISTWILQTYL